MPSLEKQIEPSQKETEAYKYALDLSAIVAITDSHGTISYINENFSRISQYSAAELIGHTHQVVNSGYHGKEFFAKMWATISSGKIWRDEIKNKAKDGSYYWMDTTIVPLPGADGQPGQYMSISSDITAGKDARDKRYDFLFNRSHEGLVIGTVGGSVVEVNHAFCAMLGYSHEEMMRLTRSDVMVTDDVNFQTSLRQREEMGQYSGYVKFKRKDGCIIDVDISSDVYTNENGELRTYVSTRDMTDKLKADEALRHSEQRFRALIENSKDVIVLSASDGQMIYFSPSIKDIFGYETDELLGTSALDIMHPDEVADNLQELIRLTENPGLSGDVVIRIKHKDGSWRWIEATSTSQLHDPAVNAVVSNFHDITERVQAEEALRDSEQLFRASLEKKIEERTIQLKEANKALESFSYIAAHDLQSPLRVVSGFAALIAREHKHELSEEVSGLFSVIVKETEHMTQLIKDLLNFSSMSHAELQKEDIDLDKMVAEVSAECRMDFKDINVRLQIHKLGKCYGDLRLIRQVWTNLVCNAIKYSSKKEHPVVEIGSLIENDEKVFYVKDNGAGFDMSHTKRLFQAFQRFHGRDEFEGTGIGLAIVSNIIIRHNGRIWADAKAGHGATFFFTIPD